jgi:hypothetical protein
VAKLPDQPIEPVSRRPRLVAKRQLPVFGRKFGNELARRRFRGVDLAEIANVPTTRDPPACDSRCVSARNIRSRCRRRNRRGHHFGIPIGLEPIVTEVLAVGFGVRLIGCGYRPGGVATGLS